VRQTVTAAGGISLIGSVMHADLLVDTASNRARHVSVQRADFRHIDVRRRSFSQFLGERSLVT
jgi:hypothetical protein